jgi:hypothetical protein
VLNWLRKKVGVSSADSVQLFKTKMHEEYSETTCSGESSWGGSCVFDATQAECEANLFNYDEWGWNAQVAVDKSKSNAAACDAAPGRRWFDNSVFVVAGDSTRSNRHGSELHRENARRAGHGNFVKVEEDSLLDHGGYGYGGAYGYASQQPLKSANVQLGCVCTISEYNYGTWDSSISDWVNLYDGCQKIDLDLSKLDELKYFPTNFDPQWSSVPLRTVYLPDSPDSKRRCRIRDFEDSTRQVCLQIEHADLALGNLLGAG